MFYHRLPNGDITKNARDYSHAWGSLAKQMLKKLPGYKLHSYDPGFVFDKREMLPDGKTYRVLDTARMSLETVKTLLKLKG